MSLSLSLNPPRPSSRSNESGSECAKWRRKRTVREGDGGGAAAGGDEDAEDYLRRAWAQWQFLAKAGAALAFMSFRSAVREEDSKEAGFDRFSLFGFHPPLPPHVVAGDAFRQRGHEAGHFEFLNCGLQ
ncbi:hypothetical protein ABZP36_001263 [Zizania latifolia]